MKTTWLNNIPYPKEHSSVLETGELADGDIQYVLIQVQKPTPAYELILRGFPSGHEDIDYLANLIDENIGVSVIGVVPKDRQANNSVVQPFTQENLSNNITEAGQESPLLVLAVTLLFNLKSYGL